jgi:heat shock protein HslJ
MPRFRLAVAPFAVPLAVAALLAGCAATRKEPPPKPFAGTRWEVVLELPIAGETPWVRFGDGRMEGFGGCNRIAALYVQDSVGASAIGIRRIQAGQHACDRSARDAEEHIVGVLQAASSYSITANTMTMSGSAGTLRFVAAPAEGKP